MSGVAAAVRTRLRRGDDASGRAADRELGPDRRSERRGARANGGRLGYRLARAERRELIAMARDQARSPVATVRSLARTSPGKLFLISAVLVIGALLIGWYASTSLDGRTAALQQTISDTEPIAESSQVLYSNLSIADAAANAAFISGGLEPPALRTRYSSAVATAAQALVQSASGTTEDNAAVRGDLDTLAQQLPVYTGLIESARTNNRLGNPVGSAYLGEASTLMQSQVLPAAERLYAARTRALGDPQNRFTGPPWAVYVLLTLLLVAILATHRYLSRRTRRRFNLGLVVAVVLVVVAFAWVLVGSLLSVSSVNAAEKHGAVPLGELTSARILAQQARSSETLSLARRGDLSAQTTEFATASGRIRAMLRDYAGAATADDEQAIAERAEAALNRWDAAHAETLKRTQSGDVLGATAQAVGDAPAGAAAAYFALDDALVNGITATRTAFRDEINTARVFVGYAGGGALVLCAVAAVTIVLGMIPRIREYR